MNTRSMFAVALALTLTSVGPLPTADAQQPDLIKQTIGTFYRQPNPMRDPRKVKAYGALAGAPGGTYTGKSWNTSIWLKDMSANLPVLSKRRYALEEDYAVFSETVDELGKDLQSKTAALNQAKLDKFSKSYGDLMKTLKAYRLVRLKQSKTAVAEAAAFRDVQSAIAAFDRDAATLNIKRNTEELADLDKRHDAIMAKVKKAAWVKDAYASVKSAIATIKDPTAIKGYLIDKALDSIDEALMNNVLMENAQVLKEIEDRQTAVKEALGKAKDEEAMKRVLTSEEALKSARLRLIVAGVERTIASIEGWDYIDELAQQERAHKAGEVFQSLQTYNAQVREVANALRHRNTLMLAVLNDGPASQAAYALKSAEEDHKFGLEADRKTPTYDPASGGDFKEWVFAVDKVRVYAKFQADWYEQEKTVCTKEIVAVMEGRHLVLVEDTVAKMLRLLGSTTEI